MEKRIETPLLQQSSGTSTAAQTLGNIIVSIVGTGILGLPFAFKVAGWLAGSIGVFIAGISTYYTMLLLVQCRDKVASEEEDVEVKTYGDVGYKCMGKAGRYFTEFLIFVSQCGGAVAYLLFIGQNMSEALRSFGLESASYIFMLVPIEIGLSWINSLSALSPFSIFADICNVLAMVLVVKDDIEQAMEGEFSFGDRKVFAPNIGGLPFATGMAVFCFEGLGMTLALQQSMKDRRSFGRLLGQAFAGIMLVYLLFGFFGYMAYGEETKDIVTLNLQRNWTAIAVQIGLSTAMTFTFPIMVHPIHEIVEGNLDKLIWNEKLPQSNEDHSGTILGRLRVYVSRAITVAGLAVLASCVPEFGVFASLVGSTICALISFVLPSTYHLIILGPSLHLWQRALDYCLIVGGLLFAAYGTYNSIVGV